MKPAKLAAIVVAVVIVIVVLGAVLQPAPTSWPGTRECSAFKKCPAVSGIDCINFTSECRNGRCVEQLAGGAECAAGWYKESTTADNVTLIASCDSQKPDPYCKWSDAQPCGAQGQACCAAGRCSGDLVCQGMACQKLVTAALR